MDRPLDTNESTPNQAQHVEHGEIREARELWALGHTRHGWVCVDENCRAQMVPCAWERPNGQGQFCDEDGVPYKRPPYFRAEPAHIKGCKASLPSGPRDRSTPETSIGCPVDHPSRVILFPVPQRSAPARLDGSVDAQPEDDGTDRRHARWTRSIQEACEYYADHPDQRWRSLRVDRCPGATYRQCFVKLGTGEPKDVGQNWIFLDEIRFSAWVDLDAEPLVLTLLSTVDKVPRRLVVPTAHWPPNSQREFRRLLRAGLKAGRAAHRQGRRERPWVFFFGREEAYDQIEFRAELQAGVAVLVRGMPRTRWDYPPSALFDKPAGRQPLNEDVQPEAGEPPPDDPPIAAVVEEVAVKELPAEIGQQPAAEETKAPLPEPQEPAAVTVEEPAPVSEPAAIERAEWGRAKAVPEANDSRPPVAELPPPEQPRFADRLRRLLSRWGRRRGP